MGGLWDYHDDEVEAYEVSDDSSTEAESDEEQPPAKRGRKGKSLTEKAESFPQTSPITGDIALLPESILISDSDDDDLVATLAKTNSPDKLQPPNSEPRIHTQKSPAVDKVLDQDTLRMLNSTQALLKQLEDDDDQDLQPEPSIPTRRRHYSTLYIPTEQLTEEDKLTLAALHAPSTASTPETDTGLTAAATTAPPDNDTSKIKLVMQSKDGKISLMTNPAHPFSKLIDKFSEHARKQGWISGTQKIRIIMDGDVISGDDTPDDQGLEDGDMLEVRY